MNSKERVISTLNKEAVDRVPLDCWVYQKKLVQKMEEVYGTHDKFMEEFNIDIFTCYVPWPNQLGKQVEVEDLTNVKLGKPKKEFWLEYNDWNQIIEIEKSGLGIIGNHSHAHGYLTDLDNNEIIADIEKSINIFKNKLGYNPIYFSYPFGEYSNSLKKIIRDYNFQFAFGQHSGVVDFTKDNLELPRFPINEKYGNIDRFKFILNLLPFQFKKNFPENKYLLENNNPPIVKVIFFKKQKRTKMEIYE